MGGEAPRAEGAPFQTMQMCPDPDLSLRLPFARVPTELRQVETLRPPTSDGRQIHSFQDGRGVPFSFTVFPDRKSLEREVEGWKRLQGRRDNPDLRLARFCGVGMLSLNGAPPVEGILKEDPIGQWADDFTSSLHYALKKGDITPQEGWQAVMSFGRDLLALSYAMSNHANPTLRLAHCSLTLGNVKLTPGGATVAADFNAWTREGQPADEKAFSRVYSGKEAWPFPESNPPTVDARSDVKSIGRMMENMVCNLPHATHVPDNHPLPHGPLAQDKALAREYLQLMRGMQRTRKEDRMTPEEATRHPFFSTLNSEVAADVIGRVQAPPQPQTLAQ
jgi:hypothetical protein